MTWPAYIQEHLDALGNEGSTLTPEEATAASMFDVPGSPLSVGSGLTEPVDSARPAFSNRRIDPRLGRGGPHRGNIQRGKLVRARFGLPTDTLHFVFNPTSVQFSYNINTDDAAAEDIPYSDVPLLGPKTTCNFQLIFDRTYEVMDGTDPLGVLGDVKALEGVLGIRTSEEGVISAALPAPISVYFGANSSMSFTGFPSNASVDMTHFTPRMIPVRLVMSISMIRTKEIDQSGATDGSGPVSPTSGGSSAPSVPTNVL